MKKIAIVFCASMLVFSLISCGSKPAPEPEQEPEAPVIEKTEPKPEPKPEPIVKEEEKEEEPEPEPEQEPEPVVIDNSETLAALDSLREDALNSGAQEFAKDELEAFDQLYQDIKLRGDNGEDISADADELKKFYEALSAYAKAKTLQADIEEIGLEEYASREYEIALAVINEIDESDLTADEFLEKAKDAYTKFNTAYIQGYKALARESRDDALKAKKDADSVKAGVAKKKEYNAAVDLFKKADALYAMQSPEKACDYYWESEDGFIELYETLFEQRAKVLAAIDEAKRKVAESAKIAELADQDSPISSSDEDLVEDEDTVLLEDDVYEESYEADIPDNIEDVENGDYESEALTEEETADAEDAETEILESEDETSDVEEDTEDSEVLEDETEPETEDSVDETDEVIEETEEFIDDTEETSAEEEDTETEITEETDEYDEEMTESEELEESDYEEDEDAAEEDDEESVEDEDAEEDF